MSNAAITRESGPTAITIVYDGECPFCASYVKLLRLRDAVGAVRLVDARTDDPAVKPVQEAGFDLDEGMALLDGDTIWHGEDCINRIALMSTPSGLFNRINATVFRSPGGSKALCPVLRGGRNLALRLIGRKKITAA